MSDIAAPAVPGEGAATPPPPPPPAAPPVRREVLANGSVRITFTDAISDEVAAKSSLTLRRPTIGEQMEIGDPLVWLVDDRASMPVTNREVILRYCSLLITDHEWEFVKRATNPALGIAIEEAILGFFRTARISLTA